MNTKILKNGDVVIMSYVELNMRDSFWASFFHLVYFPNLEWRMIHEFAIRQDITTGEIPTTVLPEILRHDLDNAMYFILRVFRYYRWTKNTTIVTEMYQNCSKAISYLLEFDIDGDSIPDHADFWADWKDVYYMNERKNSAYTALLWLATLQAMVNLTQISGQGNISFYSELYKSARAKINTPFNETNQTSGGMWDSDHYANIWKNDSKYYAYLDKPRIYEDQMVPAVFGVVPEEKLKLIIDALSKNNENEFGVCETFPYFPPEMSESEGEYHNGGIWPFIVFNDAYARLLSGHVDTALKIVRKVVKADLEVEENFIPNEYLNSQTGQGKGHILQAWSASLFQALYFGYYGVDLFDFTPRTNISAQYTLLLKWVVNSSFSTHISFYNFELQLKQTYLGTEIGAILEFNPKGTKNGTILIGVLSQNKTITIKFNDTTIPKIGNLILGDCSFDLYAV